MSAPAEGATASKFGLGATRVVCQSQRDATRSASIATEVHDPVQPDAHGAGGCGILVDDGDFASKRISEGTARGRRRRLPDETVGDGAFADTTATRAACRGAMAIHPTADRYRRVGVLHHTDIQPPTIRERRSRDQVRAQAADTTARERRSACRRGLVLAPVRSPTRADQPRARMATGADCAASGVSGANALSE